MFMVKERRMLEMFSPVYKCLKKSHVVLALATGSVSCSYSIST